MTSDDEKLFDVFEAKLSSLVERHERLKAENLELHERLRAAAADLEKARQDYAALETSYRNLKACRVLEGLDVDDVSGTRDRIVRLVREVDKCIALLNA